MQLQFNNKASCAFIYKSFSNALPNEKRVYTKIIS